MTTSRTPFAVTLGVCTAVSLAGNVGAATLLPHNLALPTPAVIAAASVAPLLLPAAVHLVPRAAGLPKGARGVVIAAVIVASIAAFALSFASLTAVAQASGHPGLLGALLPLAVDVLAGAAAYALVVMPAGASDAEQPPVHHVESAPAPEYPSGLTWLAPVHQTAPEQAVHPAAETAPEPVEQAGAPTTTSDDAVVHQETEAEPVHTEERPRLAAVHDDALAQAEPVQPRLVQPVRQRTAPEPEQAPEALPVHLAQAEAVVQSGRIELAVERVAEVYAHLDAGWSQTAIDRAKVANKRTVAKLIAARAELAAAPEAEPATA